MTSRKGEPMRTDELSVEEACLAVEWLSQKIRRRTGNNSLSFPSEWIPETGLVVFDDPSPQSGAVTGRLLAAATLYLEQSSPVAVCGWCIANPENTVWQSQRAIKLLMAAMPVYAKRHGAKYLLTTFGNRGINRILDRTGFINGEVSENKFKVL